MQLLKYQSASQKIIRFYKKKKNDMDRGLVYAYGQKVIKEDEKNKV